MAEIQLEVGKGLQTLEQAFKNIQGLVRKCKDPSLDADERDTLQESLQGIADRVNNVDTLTAKVKALEAEVVEVEGLLGPKTKAKRDEAKAKAKADAKAKAEGKESAPKGATKSRKAKSKGKAGKKVRPGPEEAAEPVKPQEEAEESATPPDEPVDPENDNEGTKDEAE